MWQSDCCLIFIRYYSEQITMNFSDLENDASSTPPSRGKVLGVIVLTDNRQNLPPDSSQQMDLSTIKYCTTQTDPLELYQSGSPSCRDENVVAELSRRVLHLQARVQALSNCKLLDSAGTVSRRMRPKKKNRRCFKQLIRDHMCPICKKMYGSDTSLKYHLKIKHNTKSNHAQVQ